jgi:hypothetical protein
VTTFSSLPQQAPEGKKGVFATASKVRRQKYWPYEGSQSTWPMKFCEPTTTSVWQRKKRIWTASCLVQIKLPEHFWREAEGREGGREEEKSLLTNLQLLSKSKH